MDGLLSSQELLAFRDNSECDIFWTDPKDLISYNRFDICAKYIYGYLRKLGVNEEISSALYRRHIWLWNGFFEEFPPKSSVEDFIGSFQNLLDASIAAGCRGLLSPVPLAHDGHALNGAHRIAASLVNNWKVLAAELDVHRSYAQYNFRFFEELGSQKGIDSVQDDLSEMAIWYNRLKPSSRLAILFDCEQHWPQISRIMDSEANIIYTRTFEIGEIGQVNLIATLYRGEPWVGSVENGFRGAAEKAGRCFASSGRFRAVLIEDCASLDELKSSIRRIVGRNKDSIHIGDGDAESSEMCELIFSRNSLSIVERSFLDSCSGFEHMLSNLQYLSRHARDRIVIVGSAVMSALGLRDCEDIDYLHLDGELSPNGFAFSHNAFTSLYSKDIHELAFDPQNYFYYKGFKFIVPRELANFKVARNETKDIFDVRLLQRTFRYDITSATAVR